MVTVSMFKVPVNTKHFNKNQIVWEQMITGALASKVTGKFRGKGRYISAWIRWDRKNDIIPEFKEIDVDNAFADRHGLHKTEG